MSISSTTDLVCELKKHTLLKATQLDEVKRTLPGASAEPQALTNELLRRGWLTAYQAKLLLLGRAGDLAMGPFLILDRIGEGGMGQVFKAQHRGLQRTVALKVLRKELVNDGEAVARFYREIKVTSQMPPHPNLIKVFDAGPLGQTHFLAMEFVEGCDLQQRVKEKGPLPVDVACDCVRQAALGLQHAHERGLVHRDIKPANLLLSDEVITGPPGTASSHLVKVLDLGLARLQSGANGSCRENTLLTSDGPVTMGTIDYQAPEQALDFHKADIRADIYSLGCTFFYLLTGKPPFGSGPMAVKLMRHQQAEPPDLKERRPEVPGRLIPIVNRMLAKKPADRYQTPGDVAAALAELSKPTQPARLSLPRSRILLAVASSAALLLLSFFLIRSSSPPPETGKAALQERKPSPPPPPAPGSVEATVPEAREYQLVYDLNLARLAKEFTYDENRQDKIKQPFDRIAYFVELRRSDGEPQYLYVSMTAFTTDVKKVGVPTLSSGASFQMNLASMNVYSNVPGIVTGTGINGGNIEFWPNNYGPNNAKKVPNAENDKYDFGDQMSDPHDGYGSMQVHNHDAKQTLFAINHWPAGKRADIGIGNNPNGNPDWTFMGNAESYRAKRLRVLVRCK